MVDTTRRGFLKALGLGSAAVAMNGCVTGLKRPHAGAGPNVVLIISDDQAWGDYSFMNHPHIETPYLDALARRSLTFTRGYVTAPLCCPSLASIITGLHPHQTGITSNDPELIVNERWERSPAGVAMMERINRRFRDYPRLPAILARTGYQSLQTGKWWQGSFEVGGFTHGMTHGDPARGGRAGDAGLAIGRYGMQPVEAFLDAVGSDPFFMWYAPVLPHAPHTAPDRLVHKYQKRTSSEPLARYWAMCEFFDETCGQLMDILQSRGFEDNTMVIYVCDNGWIQHKEIRNHFAPRSKTTRYEGGVRTPIMVSWPGYVEPRRDDTTLVSAVDIAPTILTACGLRPPKAMQGIDLLDSQTLHNRAAVCGAEYTHTAIDIDNPLTSLLYLWTVAGNWKLIVPAGIRAPESTIERFNATGSPYNRYPVSRSAELFDVHNDPAETTNLFADHPEKVQELMVHLQRWWPEGAATAVLK